MSVFADSCQIEGTEVLIVELRISLFTKAISEAFSEIRIWSKMKSNISLIDLLDDSGWLKAFLDNPSVDVTSFRRNVVVAS